MALRIDLVLSLLSLLAVAASAVPATRAVVSPGIAVPGAVASPAPSTLNDWSVQPDPPSTSQDLEVTYGGDDPDVTVGYYQTDKDAPVRVDLDENGSFVIPKSALKGKRRIKLVAVGGGEDGIRIIPLR